MFSYQRRHLVAAFSASWLSVALSKVAHAATRVLPISTSLKTDIEAALKNVKTFGRAGQFRQLPILQNRPRKLPHSVDG
jgi:hypothetical protein